MVKYDNARRNSVSGNLSMSSTRLKPLAEDLAALLLDFFNLCVFQIVAPCYREREVFLL